MRSLDKVLGVTLLALLTTTAIGCSGTATPDSTSATGAASAGSSQEPIRLGVILELTGNASVYGTEAKQAIEMALDEVDHQVDGRRIEVTWADDASDPAKASSKVRELVEKNRVGATFGPVFSDGQDAIAPYLATQNILAMAPIGGNWALHEKGNWIVYPGTLESFCEPAGSELARAGATTMTTLGADYVAGHQFIDPPAEAFRAAGGTVVQQQWVPLGTADFGAYITSLKPADIFLAWTIMPDELAMIRTFLQYKGGSDTELFLCEADNVTNEQLEQVGSELLGTRGMIAAYSSGIDNPLNRKFVADFEERYGTKPTISNGTAYITFNALLEGLKTTGGDTSLDKLRPAIINNDRDTIAGPLSFSDNGFGISSRYFARVAERDGAYFWEITDELKTVRDPRDLD